MTPQISTTSSGEAGLLPLFRMATLAIRPTTIFQDSIVESRINVSDPVIVLACYNEKGTMEVTCSMT
jgi:hypothetical protein